MSHWPEGERWDRPRGSRRGPDDEPTEVVRDEFDYFYERGQPKSEHSSRSQAAPGQQRPSGDTPPHPREPIAPARPPKRRHGSRRRKALGALGVIVLLLIGLFVYVDLQLTKVNALTDYEGRPADTPGQTWLLVGSDSREGLTAEQRQELHTGKASGGRTDTIMLLHISPFGGQSTLVSLPRDTYVTIPPFVDEDGEQHSAQEAKLNAAFAYGGPQLLARTVEQKSGMHIDHYMEIGFGGFAGIVDAVGGVRMCLKQPIHDEKSGADLAAGCQTLNGPEALAYVRSRYAVEGGDLGRIQNQRKFLRNLAQEVTKPTTMLNPFAVTSVMNATIDALIVDKHTGPFNLLWFGWQMKGLTSGDGATVTVPVAGTDTVSGAGSVVLWDEETANALFEALRQNEPIPKSVLSEQPS